MGIVSAGRRIKANFYIHKPTVRYVLIQGVKQYNRKTYKRQLPRVPQQTLQSYEAADVEQHWN